eukprot:scaffold130937_cov21-Attheya_sp.AAC.2
MQRKIAVAGRGDSGRGRGRGCGPGGHSGCGQDRVGDPIVPNRPFLRETLKTMNGDSFPRKNEPKLHV